MLSVYGLGACAAWCLGISYLVEVDVHALQLEVRGAIVTRERQSKPSRVIRQDQMMGTYTPAPSRPCSPEMVCQNAAPIWLPFTDVNHMLFTSIEFLGSFDVHTGRFGGEPAEMAAVSILLISERHRRGARVLFQGPGRAAGRTISRMLGILGNFRRGCGFDC